MSIKTFSTFLLATILLIILSFISGISYGRWQASKNSLDIDHSLVLLLARPSDFDIAGSEWVTIGSYQAYYDPEFTSMVDYKQAGYAFNVYFPATDINLGVSHNIRRYVTDKVPKATQMDVYYQGAMTTSGLQIHWLSLKELDDESTAFCTSSKGSSYISCYAESHHDDIVSTFSISSDKMTEEQVINFIIPAIQKFYERLSKGP